MQSHDPEVFMTDHSYDPRITELDDVYYVTWCNSTEHGPAIGLATTKDFKTFEQMENPLPPANRNCVMFPRKINGKFAILHRPSDRGHTPFGDIYYAESPDLTHWGCHRSCSARRAAGSRPRPAPAPIRSRRRTAGC